MSGARTARRWGQLLAGLFTYGLAISLMIRSGLGLGPWDAFHVGLHQWTGIGVGVIIAVVGFVLVVGTLFIGVRPGPGTVANMILVGVFLELVLPFVPEADGWGPGLAYHLAGILLTGVATGLYIAPGLGKGPRDGLMMGVAWRTGWPVRRVRTGIEVTVLLLGWAMGGTIGVGTILFALGIGPATEWGLRWFGVEAPAPRFPVSAAPPRPREFLEMGPMPSPQFMESRAIPTYGIPAAPDSPPVKAEPSGGSRARFRAVRP